MKRTELLKKLAEIGEVVPEREGGSHTLVRVNGVLLTIPRHAEIGEGLCKKILKQAKGGSR
jgi:predicted RNA binding protein YcfA (HicA-like mRNA interferase family)